MTSTRCCTGSPQGAPLPAFRDVTLGGNAVDTRGPGYDLVSGLGTPDVDNLVRNILDSCRRSRDEHGIGRHRA